MNTVNRRATATTITTTVLPYESAKAHNREFASRTTSVVVGYPVGGAMDVTAWFMQPHLLKFWGQTVIVENVSGAGGSIGVLKGTLFSLAPRATQSARFRPENLRLLSYMDQAEFVILVQPGQAVKNLDDLVFQMRSVSGKELSDASFGNGSIYHLIVNQVDVACTPIASPTVGCVNSGRVEPIAMTGTRRSQTPSRRIGRRVPAHEEFPSHRLVGIVWPGHLPTNIALKVNAALNESIRTPEYLKFSSENGTGVPDPGLTMPQSGKLCADDTEKLRRSAHLIKLGAN